jgi:DUF4097 and DUF4098 domain-containing protein YvlB
MVLTTVGILASLALQQVDTTVTIQPGGRLEVDNFDGTVEISTWTRNAVRVQAAPSSRTEVEVESGGGVVQVHSMSRHGPGDVNYRITVPAAIDVSVNGHSGDVKVDGTTGEISVETVEGSITARGGGGFVSLRSVEGDISLSKSKARAELNSVEGAIKVTDLVGELSAQTVDGEIVLDGVDSPGIEATTVDGDITFTGALRDGGRYRFNSHDGNIRVTVPRVNGALSVSTFDGDFESDFPLTLTGTRSSQRLNFTMGTGNVRLELESFDGNITLRKAGSTKP